MLGDIDRVLIDRHQIARRIGELGREIRRDLEQLSRDGEIVLVPVLTGSIIFVADLMRELPNKVRISVLAASSYPGKSTESAGRVEIVPLLAGDDDFQGKHVLIVDDILDSGRTIRAIREQLGKGSARSVRACVLLRKTIPSALATACEYVGFDIPDEFVVGYGLDYDNYYRNLPDIATLRKEAM